jgi:dolichyl-phosphate beta-glucosyltransferase
MWGATQPAGDSGPPVSLEIIIPAHNEEQRLPGGLKALAKAAAALPCGAAILVVDNASTDSTADIVLEWPGDPVPVRLLQCARRGKGAAVRTGLLASRAPFVGYLDADMATDLAALGTAIGLLVGGDQAVIGSRAHSESIVEERHSWLRALGAAAFRGATRIIAEGVTDTQCGFKFFSGPLVREAAATMSASGFSFDVELLARCRRLGAEVTEIPVHWRDMPGSTFSVRRHAMSAFTELASIWLSLRADAGHGPRPIPIPPALDPKAPGSVSIVPPPAPNAEPAAAPVPARMVKAQPAVAGAERPFLLSPSPGEARAPSS